MLGEPEAGSEGFLLPPAPLSCCTLRKREREMRLAVWVFIKLSVVTF